VIGRSQRRRWIAVDTGLRLTVAILLSIGAVAGGVLAPPGALAAPTARAVAAAYGYDAAHNRSEATFDAGSHGTVNRGSTELSSAGEVSAAPVAGVAVETASSSLSGLKVAADATIPNGIS
jgi:hypothetical protein